MSLEGKVAIVTGASSDIGSAIVRRLSKDGATVILVGRNLDSLEQVRSGLSGESVSMVCDATDEALVQQTVDGIVEKYGKIDILVNGVGSINDPVHFHKMPSQDIRGLIHGNILAVMFPTKAVLAKMYEAKSGAIVNIGSISSDRAIPKVHLAAYSAVKSAVNMFTKAIAVEYARSNVRCNCVNLGVINSGIMKPYLEDQEARRVLLERLPLGRIGEPDDVAGAVSFLVSKDAAWITGTVLDVDGGKSASEA